MKVLLVSPQPPPAGGIATWTKNLLGYFDVKAGEFVVIHQDTSLKYRKLLNNGLLSRVYFGIRESIKIITELKLNLITHSPDILHLTSSASLALLKDYFILRIANKRKIPLIIHWHFGRIPNLATKRNWEWKLLTYILQKCQYSIVIDSKSYNTLIKSGFNNIINIPNPIGEELEQKVKKFISGVKQHAQGNLIFVGHIIKAKGVFELVETCTQIPIVKELSLIGPCELAIKEELLRIANNRDKGMWLKFYGTLSNERVIEHMQESPILILPSYTEGFPIVVIEAMSVGCSVIATEVGAIPEMLDVTSASPCGICIPIKTPGILKEAIVTLLNDPEKSEAMGENGVKKVLNSYTMEKVVEQYISLWRKAAKSQL